MRWTIRSEIMMPMAVLVLVFGLGSTLFSAYFSARQSEQNSFRQLRSLLDTLGRSRFPSTPHVLESMKGMSGAEFIALRKGSGDPVHQTIPLPLELRRELPDVVQLEQMQEITHLKSLVCEGESYFVAKVSNPYSNEDLFVLYPEERIQQARWNAVFSPLVVGLVTAAIGLILSIWLAERLARHIRGVREQLTQLTQRHFVQIDSKSPIEELHDLQTVANQLSTRLSELEGEIVRTERLRLLAQIAGGIAHHLRNAVTGARLAVQLHRRRCSLDKSDESLEIAERQLSLMEEQIKGMLALGSQKKLDKQSGDLVRLAHEVYRLLFPLAKHVGIAFEQQHDLPEGTATVSDADAVRAAIVNLVSNAIDAVGTQGTVKMRTACENQAYILEVEDSGPGPNQQMQDEIFEPFITTKAEGVGLGLFLARQTVEATGGRIVWQRRENHTIFRLEWPIAKVLAE